MFSTARRKRNHRLKLMRRASTHETPPRSKTTTPHPPPCRRRSVDSSACSSRFQGLVRLASCRARGVRQVSEREGKGRGGLKPRRGGSLSLSTCSPEHRETTWICVDSAKRVPFPTSPGIASSTPRISTRGCRHPLTSMGFLLQESGPRVFLTSLPRGAK